MTKASPEIEQLAAERLAADEARSPAARPAQPVAGRGVVGVLAAPEPVDDPALPARRRSSPASSSAAARGGSC